MKCPFKTLHQYRASLGLMLVLGVLTGLSDASIEDFTAKAFLWTGFALATLSAVSYEFIVMQTPEKPMLQAVLFSLAGLSATLSAHHFTWLFVSILIGRKIEKTLWLAPNIYTDFTTYTTLMSILLASSTAYLIYCNICSSD